jgi:hypothetical protein
MRGARHAGDLRHAPPCRMQVRGHGDLLSAEHCPALGVRSTRGSRWRGSSNRSSRVRPAAAPMSSISQPRWQSSSTRSVPCVTGSDGFLSPWAGGKVPSGWGGELLAHPPHPGWPTFSRSPARGDLPPSRSARYITNACSHCQIRTLTGPPHVRINDIAPPASAPTESPRPVRARRTGNPVQN